MAEITATPASADRHPAIGIVFSEPRRVELEEMVIDLRDIGPHEVVVQARRSVISPGTELAYYRGDSLVGLAPARLESEPTVPSGLCHGRNGPRRRARQ